MNKLKPFPLKRFLARRWVLHPIQSYIWYKRIGGSKAFKIKLDLAKTIKVDHDQQVADYLALEELMLSLTPITPEVEE